MVNRFRGLLALLCTTQLVLAPLSGLPSTGAADLKRTNPFSKPSQPRRPQPAASLAPAEAPIVTTNPSARPKPAPSVQPIDDFAIDEPNTVVRVSAQRALATAPLGPEYAGPQRVATDDADDESAAISDGPPELEYDDDAAYGISDIGDDDAGQVEHALLNSEQQSTPPPDQMYSYDSAPAETFAAEPPQVVEPPLVQQYSAAPVANAPAAVAPLEPSADEVRSVVTPTPVVQHTNPAPRSTRREAPSAPVAIEPERIVPPGPGMLFSEADSIPTFDQGSVTLEWQTPQEVSLGQQLHCQLLVRNTSQQPVQNVRIQATLPGNVQLDSARPKPHREAANLGWQFDEIEGAGSRTIEIELTPKAEGQFIPQATVTFTRVTQARIQVLKPQIALSIVGPEQLISGHASTYEFVVSNPGSGRAHNVIIEATLPEQLRHTDGPKLAYSVGTLGPQESRTVQVMLTAAQAGNIALAAQARAAGGVSSSQEFAIEVVRPRLDVAVDGPSLRYVDRPAVYTVRVHNPGPAPANNVQVLDAIPAGFRFVDASAGGTYDNSTRQVAWFVGRLEANTTAEVGVQLIPTELGDQRLVTEVKADSGVAEQAETLTRVEGVEALVIDVVDTDDPVEVHGETTYEIRVTNRGSKSAVDVQVAARAAAETEIIDAAGPAAAKISGTQVVFDPIPALEPGRCELFRVRVVCRSPGEVGFKAYFRTAEQSKAIVAEELTRIYQD